MRMCHDRHLCDFDDANDGLLKIKKNFNVLLIYDIIKHL